MNVAYLVYDLCQEFGIPESQRLSLLGFRGYLHIVRICYYATPEGAATRKEALNAVADPFAAEATDR